jgi:hypothetical protein
MLTIRLRRVRYVNVIAKNSYQIVVIQKGKASLSQAQLATIGSIRKKTNLFFLDFCSFFEYFGQGACLSSKFYFILAGFLCK